MATTKICAEGFDKAMIHTSNSNQYKYEIRIKKCKTNCETNASKVDIVLQNLMLTTYLINYEGKQ